MRIKSIVKIKIECQKINYLHFFLSSFLLSQLHVTKLPYFLKFMDPLQPSISTDGAGVHRATGYE